MTDLLTLTGLVATEPKHLVTSDGLPITSFRLASAQRRYNRSEQKWIDGETNWYTVTCFRQLAINVSSSVDKGNRVVVTGRLRIRDWTSGDKAGTTVEVDADAVGHDLAWGTAVYTRSASARSDSDTEPTGHAGESATGGDGEADANPVTRPGEHADAAPDSATPSSEDRVPIPF